MTSSEVDKISQYQRERVMKIYAGEWDFKKEYMRWYDKDRWRFIKENPMLHADVKERRREYSKTPKRREYLRQYYLRKKLEGRLRN